MPPLVRNIRHNQKFYDAIDAAFENFGNNESINPHKFFADKLGFNGAEKEKNIYRKLSEFEPNHRLYADELVLICEYSGVYSAPIAAFFMSFCSNSLEPNRLSLHQAASAFSKIFGNFNSQLIEAMSDGIISEPEKASLVPMLDDAMAKLQRMRAALAPVKTGTAE
jgi:hypothetical protein